MARAHEHLRRLLAGGLIEGRRPQWAHALALLKSVSEVRSPESESVLRDVALFDGKLLLDEEAGLPHAMSPEDMLRSLSAQTLAGWDRRRHRDVIRHASAPERSALVRRILHRWR
jgi:hypothetical protein